MNSPGSANQAPQFRPAWWLPGPHLQTLWPQLRGRPRPVVRQRERLNTPDGDFLDLDWAGPGEGPLVLLVHGLTGSSRSHYIRGLEAALLRRGFRTVAMNFRGCSGRMNDTSRCYHSGETGDIAWVYACLRKREPDTPLGVVGFSLGGNVVLKWLGEQGIALDLFGAAAVSVPILLDVCASQMDRGFSRFYRDRLVTELKAYLRHKRLHLERIGCLQEARRIAELGDLSGVKSFWEYDQRVIAALYDFRDVDDYYRRSSSRQFLSSISVPTLIIQARDDPFMTDEVIPDADELAREVRLEVSSAGGHVGYVSGIWPGQPRYWLDRRIPSFLAERLASAVAHN